MSEQVKSSIIRLAALANAVGMIVLAALAALLTGATLLAAAGVLPWLEFQAGFGGVIYENAGQIAQIGTTVLLLLLTVYLPSAHRVLRLETSHRRFRMGMEDVTRAYAAAHAADRAGLFHASSEYDAVRERMLHLRDHPDLQALEPDLLEVAAQMSRVSADLANTYSDANVARARAFLTARQQEIDSLNERIDQAKQVTTELQSWKTALDSEEAVAASQMKRLRETLEEVLPELSRPEETAAETEKVVPMPTYAAE
ncbi:DNA repair protein [Roseovarius sp. CAU 1744]|uniref:DNA repair protein n=1 Tax=Roseovarius sp. CAU 1744 TaxID=3140368 RepID=UPI00325ADE93